MSLLLVQTLVMPQHLHLVAPCKYHNVSKYHGSFTVVTAKNSFVQDGVVSLPNSNLSVCLSILKSVINK